MNKLKLKIRDTLKESKVTRSLDLNERWLFELLSESIILTKIYAKSIGLIHINKDGTGVFINNNIRDATDEERQAWLYLQIIEGGNHKCSNISIDRCPNCIFKKKHGLCIATSPNIEYSREILKDKEVILEVKYNG